MKPVDALQVIQQVKPAALVVHLAGGRQKTLAVPSNRKRWAWLKAELGALDWSEIDLNDEHGNTVTTIAPEGAGTLEDQIEKIPANTREGEYTRCLLRFQEITLTRFENIVKHTLETCRGLIDMLGQRVVQLEAQHSVDVEQIREAVLAYQQGEQLDDTKMVALMAAGKLGILDKESVAKILTSHMAGQSFPALTAPKSAPPADGGKSGSQAAT